MRILIMGVAGCGKTAFGRAVAAKLKLPFYDADDYHSPEAVAKMSRGQPLSDEERLPWLECLGDLLWQQPRLVLACSALKRHYRTMLRQAAPELRICYLQGSFETILARMEMRQTQEGHFFQGAEMLRSQFASLEEPQVDEMPLLIPVELSPAEQLVRLWELL